MLYLPLTAEATKDHADGWPGLVSALRGAWSCCTSLGMRHERLRGNGAYHVLAQRSRGTGGGMVWSRATCDCRRWLAVDQKVVRDQCAGGSEHKRGNRTYQRRLRPRLHCHQMFCHAATR